MDTKKIMEKADIAVGNLIADGGYLNPEQSNRFIIMMMDQPTIIKDVRVVRMNSPIRKIDKIGFGSRILRAAPASGSYLPDADRSKPDLGQVTLTTKEVIAEVHLPYDVLEDNIERGNLNSTIMSLIAERASVDCEEWILLADTAIVGDAFLALGDGALKLAVDHVIDSTAAPVGVSKALFKAGIRQLPDKYFRVPSDLRFYISPAVATEWIDEWADRETAEGDAKMRMGGTSPAYGVPMNPSALMPDDKYLLTFPKNMIWGIQRQIQVETDKDIRARTYIIVLTMRMDFKFEETDAVVKYDGINPDA